MQQYSELYRNELLSQVIPFWEQHSIDQQDGGFFTCLNRQGEVFDTDKFIWLQGRQVWMFASLYSDMDQKEQWLEIAKHGAAFLLEHGRDPEGNWYFSLDKSGKPLVQAYNIFSDCFATMAFGALFKATQQQAYADLALSTFENILKRRGNTKGKYNKMVAGTRDLRNFSLPMILSNLALEIESLLPATLVDQLLDEVVHEVMDIFYDADKGIIYENVCLDGSFSDSFEGRLLNPGHTIEAMWFIMEIAQRRKDQPLLDKAVQIAFNALDYGWDNKFGGIFYFLDVKGNPPQQLEWDQKLWWVHLEALVCMAKAWKYTQHPQAKVWFEKLHDYTWSHFKDPEFPEWYGYLNRQGEVLLPLKGGKWKGCFHLPRALWQVSQTLAES